jgi:hypothetical protein
MIAFPSHVTPYAHLLPILLFVVLACVPPAIAGDKPPLILEEGAEFMEKKEVDGTTFLYLQGEIRWRRGESRLMCARARYYEESGMLFLSRNVHLLDEGREILADSVRYEQETSHAVTIGSSILLLSNGDVTVLSDSMDYAFDAREAWAFKRPRVVLQTESGDRETTDETVVDGERLHMKEDAFLAVVGDVAILGDSLSGGSDSLHYDLAAETITMLGTPWIEMGTYRLFGEKIDLYAPERSLRRGIAQNGARGEERVSGPDEDGDGKELVNWIEGGSIVLSFENDRIDSLVASPEARSFYRIRQEGESEENYVLGDEIILIWREGEIDAVHVRGNGEGVYRRVKSGEE